MRLTGKRILAALVSAVLASPAMAAPAFYVMANAQATTSGNITNGESKGFNTGQVEGLTTEAGPFTAGSGGQFYSFAANAHARTELGSVHASVGAGANSSGPAGGGSASAQGQWSDQITITSATLPQGTLVQLLATITLHREITGGRSGSGSRHASANVTGPFGLSLIDTLDTPNPTQTVSTIVTTTVGQTLTATSTLSLQADASGFPAPFTATASVEAENTATFNLTPITPGVSYTTVSGVTFVPEPASGVVILTGIALLGGRRVRKA